VQLHTSLGLSLLLLSLLLLSLLVRLLLPVVTTAAEEDSSEPDADEAPQLDDDDTYRGLLPLPLAGDAAGDGLLVPPPEDGSLPEVDAALDEDVAAVTIFPPQLGQTTSSASCWAAASLASCSASIRTRSSAKKKLYAVMDRLGFFHRTRWEVEALLVVPDDVNVEVEEVAGLSMARRLVIVGFGVVSWRVGKKVSTGVRLCNGLGLLSGDMRYAFSFGLLDGNICSRLSME